MNKNEIKRLKDAYEFLQTLNMDINSMEVKYIESDKPLVGELSVIWIDVFKARKKIEKILEDQSRSVSL
jgi:hypothetical protein